MMGRLIDADALMNEKVWLAEISEDARVFRFAVPCGVIANAPTIDAQPVVYGHWISQNTGRTLFACSNCHKGNYGGHERYCPNCGAKMIREET